MQDFRGCLIKVKNQGTYSDILMILTVLYTKAVLLGYYWRQIDVRVIQFILSKVDGLVFWQIYAQGPPEVGCATQIWHRSLRLLWRFKLYQGSELCLLLAFRHQILHFEDIPIVTKESAKVLSGHNNRIWKIWNDQNWCLGTLWLEFKVIFEDRLGE